MWKAGEEEDNDKETVEIETPLICLAIFMQAQGLRLLCHFKRKSILEEGATSCKIDW